MGFLYQCVPNGLATSLFLCFPSFLSYFNMLTEDRTGQSLRGYTSSTLETQPWFTILLHLLVDKPLLLPQSTALLIQPHNNALHPLRNHMRLIACKVSGKPSSREAFQGKLQKSFCDPGLRTPPSNMNHTLRNGQFFAINEKLIPLTPL